MSDFKVGDKVKLCADVLQKHARSIPAYAGYTKEQFSWRKTLDSLKDKVGSIKHVFQSDHVNVDFDGQVIGISYKDLVKAE